MYNVKSRILQRVWLFVF